MTSHAIFASSFPHSLFRASFAFFSAILDNLKAFPFVGIFWIFTGAIFLSKIASVSSDGLLKVWTSENNWNGDVGSFDAHEDKIWAVECVASEKIITGN